MSPSSGICLCSTRRTGSATRRPSVSTTSTTSRTTLPANASGWCRWILRYSLRQRPTCRKRPVSGRPAASPWGCSTRCMSYAARTYRRDSLPKRPVTSRSACWAIQLVSRTSMRRRLGASTTWRSSVTAASTWTPSMCRTTVSPICFATSCCSGPACSATLGRSYGSSETTSTYERHSPAHARYGSQMPRRHAGERWRAGRPSR